VAIASSRVSAAGLTCQRYVRRIHNDSYAQIANLRQEIRRDSVAVFDAYSSDAPHPGAAVLLYEIHESFGGTVECCWLFEEIRKDFRLWR
jgi:hypothetical protein